MRKSKALLGLFIAALALAGTLATAGDVAGANTASVCYWGDCRPGYNRLVKHANDYQGGRQLQFESQVPCDGAAWVVTWAWYNQGREMGGATYSLPCGRSQTLSTSRYTVYADARVTLKRVVSGFGYIQSQWVVRSLNTPDVRV